MSIILHCPGRNIDLPALLYIMWLFFRLLRVHPSNPSARCFIAALMEMWLIILVQLRVALIFFCIPASKHLMHAEMTSHLRVWFDFGLKVCRDNFIHHIRAGVARGTPLFRANRATRSILLLHMHAWHEFLLARTSHAALPASAFLLFPQQQHARRVIWFIKCRVPRWVWLIIGLRWAPRPLFSHSLCIDSQVNLWSRADPAAPPLGYLFHARELIIACQRGAA